MKRLLSAIVVIVMLFVSIPFHAIPPVYSQETPPLEEILPEFIDFPEIVPGQSPDTSAQLPPTDMESVEIYEPPVLVPQPDPPGISVGVEPQIYIENSPITISWSLLNIESKIGSERTIRFALPEDLRPADPAINSQVSIEGVLILPASDLFSSIEFNHVGVIEDDQDYIYLSLDLLEDGLWLDGEDIQIPTRGYTLEDIKLDDVKMYFPANVEITTEDLQIEQKLLFQVGTPKSHNMPAYNLSGNPFEILAVNPLTAKNVTQFSTPLEITLVYDATQFSEQQEAMLQVFYYDPDFRDWFAYETVVDTENNLLSIQTEHLTIFDIGVRDWQAYMPSSIKDFEVSGFTGAAIYEYPIQTFDGPGGLKPGLSLSYNSQVVDQGAAFSQASWVGMGWSLETGYITRDMHGTNFGGEGNNQYPSQDDDTFLVNLNNMSGRLLPAVKSGSRYEYVLQNNPTTLFFL